MGCGTSSSQKNQNGVYEPEDKKDGKQDKQNAKPQPKSNNENNGKEQQQNENRNQQNQNQVENPEENNQNNNNQVKEIDANQQNSNNNNQQQQNQNNSNQQQQEPEYKTHDFAFIKTDKYDPKLLKSCILSKNKFDKHEKEIERNKGRNFIDIDFLGKEQSLTKDPTLIKNIDKIKWKRVKDIYDFDKIRVFQKKIEPTDVQQGDLNNVYFLSALSVIAERPNLIERLFMTKQKTETGLYSVVLCIDGEFQEIIIDDMFPVNEKDQPVFARSNEKDKDQYGDELWVLILEKAYAKAFGSYQQIMYGNAGEAIRDLTGAPYEIISTIMGEDKVWEFIKNNYEKGAIITAGSTASTSSSIQKKHSYAILDCREVENNGKHRIVKLREPWGKFEWKGDWSDKSEKWTEDLKAQCNLEVKDDGIFWMNITDFSKQFFQVTSNRLVDDYLYHSQKVTLGKESMALVKFHVKYEDTHVYFSLSQKDERHFVKKSDYSYSFVRLVISNISGTKFIAAKQDKLKDFFVEFDNMQEGEYYAFIEVDWHSNRGDADSLVISSYSSDQIQFEENYQILTDDNMGVLDTMLLNAPLEEPDKIYQYPQSPEVTRIANYHCGYFYFKFENKSTNKTLSEVVKLDEISNMKICPPYTLSSMFDITVNPGETKLVKYRITSQYKDNFGYKASYNGGIDLEDPELIEEAKVKGHNERKKRGDYEVYYYPYHYSKGFAIVHWNCDQGEYEEEMDLGLTNLSLRGQEHNATPQIKLKLKPGEACIHRLDVKDKKQEYKFKISLWFDMKK